MFSTESALVWTLIASLYLGNVMLLVLNLPLVKIWVKLLQIPRPYLYAGILLFASLGCYAVNASTVDLIILLVVGYLGFALRQHGWPVAPAVVGLILGPIAEENLRRALAISQGDLTVLVHSLFSVVILSVAALAVLVPAALRLRAALRRRAAQRVPNGFRRSG